MDTATSDQPAFRLPTGTATFMLAGVVGSGAVTTRHIELLDEVVSRHGGVRRPQQDNGMSAAAVFPHAPDAVTAALEAQRACHTESWPGGVSLRPRIAVHTAQARRRGGEDYFGPEINRCARLSAVAHDGQIVLSRATRDLVLDRLPDHAELIFGLTHPDLPAEFPPLRSPDTVPNNLPSELTTFVGRRAELVQVGDPL